MENEDGRSEEDLQNERLDGISDEQLDALLRSVEVPSDLKSQLLTITDEDNQVNPATPSAHQSDVSSRQPNRGWIGFVLAASLMFVLVYVGWQWWGGEKIDQVNVAEIELDDPVTTNPGDREPSMESSPGAGLAEIENSDPGIDLEQERLKEAIAQIHRSRELIETQLQIAELSNARNNVGRLAGSQATFLRQRDFESMVVAMADQVVIPLGGAEELARTDMARVIEKYPGSKGALIARKFLEQQSN